MVITFNDCADKTSINHEEACGVEGNEQWRRRRRQQEERPARLVPVSLPDDVLLSGAENGHLCPKEYEGRLEGVMIAHGDIVARTEHLARLLKEDYGNERPLFICVLKGASMFFHQLLADLTTLQQGYTYDFLRAQSYDGDSSTGQVTVSGGLDYALLRGKHVIVVEDIVDTGITLSKLIPILQREGNPKSIEVCTLLEKRLDRDDARMRAESATTTTTTTTVPKYCGFSIPNKFVVGYGLDYDELFRDLRDIWVVSKAGVEAGGTI